MFDGQSQTIANLKIAPTETTHNIGLFGVIGSAGVVRDLNLTDVSVSAGPGARAVGTLAGVNHGTITNIYVTGNVDGGDAAGAWLGGLVGVNGGFGRPGSITAAAVNVGVSSAGSNVVLGGLAAFNSRYSTILASIATGNVTSTAGVEGGHVVLGGLVGINRGLIAGDAAYGNVGSANSRKRRGRRSGRQKFRHDRVLVDRARNRAGWRQQRGGRAGRVQPRRRND